MSAILPGIVEEAERLLDAASGNGTTLALLGGVAVRLKASDIPASLDREYKDIDFAAPKGASSSAAKLFSGQGYEPAVAFNAMNGRDRLLFYDQQHGRQIDVFIGSFRMCHEIPFGNRLAAGEQTSRSRSWCSPSCRSSSSTRRTSATRRCCSTATRSPTTTAMRSTPRAIAELCGNDWGLWRTITPTSSAAVSSRPTTSSPRTTRRCIAGRIDQLLAAIEAQPKSRGWRLRARVGERKRWYELPEEVDR